MEGIDVSPQFKTTSLSVPSLTASHVACLSGARLQIRSLTTFEIVRSIPLPQSHDLRNSRIVWSPPSTASHVASTPPRSTRFPPRRRSHRILVTDDATTRVYDLRDAKWNAVINNGSGGMGKNTHVEFGRTDEEVLVWSDFASRVMVWCLRTGRTVEIRDPKFSGKEGKGWGYRSRPGEEDGEGGTRGGMLAMLCRSAGQDVLMLLAPRTYRIIKRVELSTIDVQGLKWSPDGRWLAVWDSAGSGYRLCIYTADGHLYRTITREPSDELNEWGIEGLGIKTVEWVCGSEYLAVGGWDRRVRILSTRTFSPVVFLDHTAQICVPSATVYTEQVDATGARSYAVTQQPATPLKSTVEKNESGLIKLGISILAFSNDGTLCATKDDSTPTTVWIWDLRSLKPKTILIQHSPVKSLQWHPTNPSHLLIQTMHDSPMVYLYSTPTLSSSSSTSTSSPRSALGPPTILDFSDRITRPGGSPPAKWATKWLNTAPDKKPALALGHQQGYILVWPEGKDQILRFEREEGAEESDDSLYDILTGRTPVPPLHRNDGGSEFEEVVEMGIEGEGDGESMGSIEDTFRGKRGVTAGTVRRERGRSMLDESGLDEMF
ncbi:WD40 repeat-like protein [Lentithecium fluviatile CBS 122367]|uniref:WD40 repeat-like protein n=1 Tax=Lentithecium fluviatile CBS 122367 TaxID=1168545 RepID=A0A6G1J070_9PLEO|nr:WD40 repeat-like protein [Lentithecium fluviatile CBS 122367]